MGSKNVPVPFRREGDSSIFADCAAKIGIVPVNGYVFRRLSAMSFTLFGFTAVSRVPGRKNVYLFATED